MGSVPKSVASDIPGSRVRRCSPVEGSFSHSHYSIWLMVEGLGAQHTAAGWQAGSHHDGCILHLQQQQAYGPAGSQPAVWTSVGKFGSGQ